MYWKPTLLSLASLASTVIIAALAVRGVDGPLALTVQSPGVALWAVHFNRSRSVPIRVSWIVAMWLALVVSFSLAGGPLAITLFLGTSAAVGCLIGYQVLTSSFQNEPFLKTRDDLMLFGKAFIACVLSAMIIAFVGAWITGAGSVLVAALAMGTLTAMSFGLAIPMICHTTPSKHSPWVTEHLLHWVAVCALTLLLFSTPKGQSLIYLLVPLVGYAALRFPLKEAIAQVWVIAGSAIVLEYGLVPGSHAIKTTFSIPLPADLHLVPVSTLTLVCLFVVIIANITNEQLTNVRGELKETAAQLEETLQTATGTALLETDMLGKIVFFSRGAELMTGYEAEEVLGRSPAIFFSPESLTDISRRAGVPEPDADQRKSHADRYNHIGFTLGKRAITRPAKGYDWKFTHKDGRNRWASTFITPKLNEHGKWVGFVGTCKDVTRRVESARSLNEALSKEREAVLRLAEVDRVKDQFISTVSHELRTPITNIIGYTELLEDGDLGPLNKEQDQAITRISFSGRRLLSLVNDLLTLSRVQQRGLEKKTAAFDLRDIVRSSVDLVKPAGGGAQQPEITVDLPESPVCIAGDGEKLERAVINLLSNATKFTPPDGTVHVSLVTDEESVRVSVADSGRGMSEEEQALLFTRFFRAESAERDAIPGSGLGLSIVKTIVDLHDGEIDVVSAPGEGSTFTIRLPKAECQGDGKTPAA